MKSRNNKKGFTLLEIIVVVYIFSIGILAMYRILPGIINATTIDSSKVAAIYLAQEGIEIVRNVRDSNWLQVPANWDNGFDTAVCGNGCEVDYRCLVDEDPKLGTGVGGCFRPYSSSDYLKIGPDGFFNHINGIDTKFLRKITVVSDVTSATVTVDVLWSEKGKSYNFSEQEILYNWY